MGASLMGIWHYSGGWAADATALALALLENPGGAPQAVAENRPVDSAVLADRLVPLVMPHALASPGKVVDLSLTAKQEAIPRDPDGLFYITALVNGVRVRFLVDTGASTIVLTLTDADRAGVFSAAPQFQETAETAGGQTAMVRVKLARLIAGPAEDSDVDAAVVGDGLGVSLLGQSWLSKFRSVTIRGDRMELK